MYQNYSIFSAYYAAGFAPSQQELGFVSSQHGLGPPQQPSGAFSAQHGFSQSVGQVFPLQLPSAFSLPHVLAAGQSPQPDAGQAPASIVFSFTAGSLFVKPPNKTEPTNNATTTPPTTIRFFWFLTLILVIP
jgi:hypothetical protein